MKNHKASIYAQLLATLSPVTSAMKINSYFRLNVRKMTICKQTVGSGKAFVTISEANPGGDREQLLAKLMLTDSDDSAKSRFIIGEAATAPVA